jgi:hypothetical protein
MGCEFALAKAKGDADNAIDGGVQIAHFPRVLFLAVRWTCGEVGW